MDDPLYREIILDHWKNPQNYGVMKDPDIDVTRQNKFCGDKVRIMAKIKNGKIEEISFTCSGCVIAKALASQLTLIAKGMKVEEFTKMDAEDFLKTVEISFSPARLKCALLGFSTLKNELEKK